MEAPSAAVGTGRSSWRGAHHGVAGVEMVECESTEERLRCTPTWRAKCRIMGSDKTLKVRTLGCARRSPPADP